MGTKKQWRDGRYLRIILWFSVLFLMLFLDVRCAGYIVTWQQEMEQVCQVQQGLQKQNAERLLRPLLEEAECFPVRRAKGQKKSWGFDDGYGEGRSYGGSRSHEGIDIMPVSDDRKQIPVQSVSDGVVEQLGWLELGGYRVGIRTESGLYFYYAHLERYAPGLQKGDGVQAGTLLGYMGDTGYGPEGTRGKFPVHLHFGIYHDRDGEESTVNPYYLLRYLEHDEQK